MSNNLKKELARVKMEKAREAWEEALWCFEGGKYPATVNRIYYCMYRACLALLVFEYKVPTKHSSIIGMVNKKYVKNKEFTKEEAEELIENGEKALAAMEEFLEKILEEI
ncbi:HEPN domain-containing protein [Desulfitibacter alkalitolerans]|uniref:HEPN domain-containing protein n=1 Tax=Desulfitibacter alkalitolerans TaxID=264641 RepID=UPI000487AEEB|nr:HEPN domain-containing protein [Desulfitibacter alkalitolerans]